MIIASEKETENKEKEREKRNKKTLTWNSREMMMVVEG
jgi:hypothetical protein